MRLALRRGEVERRHPVQHEGLRGLAAVDAGAADEPRPRVDLGESHVAIDLIAPLQLVAMGEVAQVCRRLPGVIARLPEDIRHVHPAAIEAGEDAQIEAQPAPPIGDVRQADVALGVRPPVGEAQVVGADGGIGHKAIPLGGAETTSPRRLRMATLPCEGRVVLRLVNRPAGGVATTVPVPRRPLRRAGRWRRRASGRRVGVRPAGRPQRSRTGRWRRAGRSG